MDPNIHTRAEGYHVTFSAKNEALHDERFYVDKSLFLRLHFLLCKINIAPSSVLGLSTLYFSAWENICVDWVCMTHVGRPYLRVGRLGVSMACDPRWG